MVFLQVTVINQYPIDVYSYIPLLLYWPCAPLANRCYMSNAYFSISKSRAFCVSVTHYLWIYIFHL